MPKLKLVTEGPQQKAAREEEEEQLKLGRGEIKDRVHEIRAELEAAKQRYDAALFDNWTDGMPASLDVVGENREPYGAVSYLAPLLGRVVSRLQQDKNISDDVVGLYVQSTQTAYAIGMLAGALYADCPTTVIDRFERGMTAALAASHWIAKREER